MSKMWAYVVDHPVYAVMMAGVVIAVMVVLAIR
jgi:hypothetical protein